MLTPIDIQSKSFKGGFGYDRKEVNDFIAQIVENYENLYKQNQDLSKKIEGLNSALSQYKTIEKSLQKALLLAQKASEDIKEQAHATAKIIEDEARNKALQIVAEAKNELEFVHRKTIALMQQYELYKTQFEQLAKTQVHLLKSDSFNLKISDLSRLSDIGSNTRKENKATQSSTERVEDKTESKKQTAAELVNPQKADEETNA